MKQISIDNLAINSKDQIFITNMANNGIYEIDQKTGVAVSDSGTIYVTGDLENVLYKILPK
jgi:hypothetical protein